MPELPHQRRDRIEIACAAAGLRRYVVDLDQRSTITFVVERAAHPTLLAVTERAEEIVSALRAAGFETVVVGPSSDPLDLGVKVDIGRNVT